MSIDPIVLLNQASVWQQEGKLQEAEQAYRQVLAADPANPDAMNLLALIHHEKGQRDHAIRLLRAAIKIQPAARYYTNLGVVLAAHGDRTGSISAYRQAIALNPSGLTAWPGVIFSMDLHPYSLPSVRLADRRALNRQHCAALTAEAAPHTNDPDPDRRLRIGYISADFRSHSASMVFDPVLTGHHARNEMDVYLYWQQEDEPDDLTKHFAALADTWTVVNELSDETLAETIRADGIDILVDLSGYSNGNRLLTLARKPAPIIMTGWGHVTGLGIDACDYILADAVTVPSAHESLYHERILRLPSIVAYDPHLDTLPPVTPPPAEQNGYVTFGYLGRASKTSEAVWAAWAQILHRVPHSRLILKGNDYLDGSYRDRILDFFVSLRISSHRLEFHGPSPHAHHLAAHAQIDIALDPFPQGGGVTTLEATLMGVPTVALMGNYLNGRIAPSILAAAGWDDWVATSEPEYIDMAVKLADAVGRWTIGDRMVLRHHLKKSILMDANAYTEAVEDVYREAWRRWCREQRGEVAA